MAKGLRASTKKANRSKLRSKVFEPVEDARTERLSAKLLEIASRPRPKADEDVRMEEGDKVQSKQQDEVPESKTRTMMSEEDMGIENNASTSTARPSSGPRVQKKRRFKAKSTAAFPVYSKGKRIGARRSSPILTFAIGFFPHKPFLPGRSQHHPGEIETIREPPFNKVIFMVVDALRSDFVYSNESGFLFTQSLIRSGAALPFTAHATSPTITMPRVKAITTGSIPSFLDVILNFAESDTSSSLATQDTWPAQLRAKPGGKLVMYGDDTWLKLFPDMFSRSDGTSSFFVSDFTEVDHNVTRHVPFELNQKDWNGMFMHYLGLDHIGHKSGPRSPHMVPKHREMDGIVQEIYEALESRDHLHSTLLVLCGDHGMNDAGNHGGSAPGETSPALVFVSPKLREISSGKTCPPSNPEDEFQYYSVVEQSDVAPTLAGLLGFPIPMNNLGVFIPELLRFWPDDQKISMMNQNAAQVLRIVKAAYGDAAFDDSLYGQKCARPSSDIEQLLCQWREVSISQEKENLERMTKFLRSAQSIMSSAASNYDVSKLEFGIAIALMAAVVALLALWTTAVTTNPSTAWAGVVTVAYGAMMFASSYVEEEHHFWYWIGSGWLGWLHIKLFWKEIKLQSWRIWTVPLLFATNRIVRRWNQTGQKHAGEPDISKTFFSTHSLSLWTLVIITFIDLVRRLTWYGLPGVDRRPTFLVTLGLCLSAFGFKVGFTIADAPELLAGIPSYLWAPMGEVPLVTQARTVFAGIALSVLYSLYRRFYRTTGGYLLWNHEWPLHDLLTLLLVTQSRVTNIPLFLISYIQLHVLSSLNLDSAEITVTSAIFQYASFFAFGGSNAISSIDLSNAYNGVSEYNVVAVGILTFIGNWAGPIWWVSATNILLLEASRREKRSVLEKHATLLTAFTASSLVFVMLACTMLRTHLFIWTVFSPKYLYSMAWSIGQHLMINMGFGRLLYRLGSPDG
ncbi:major facilitator super transporter protein [Trapelia coarctata]|nr:major facilitator super transporter protein [Trapelia coarctata]